jgi:hypothetical protein
VPKGPPWENVPDQGSTKSFKLTTRNKAPDKGIAEKDPPPGSDIILPKGPPTEDDISHDPPPGADLPLPKGPPEDDTPALPAPPQDS